LRSTGLDLAIDREIFGRFGVRVALVTYAASMAAKVVTVALVMVLF